MGCGRIAPKSELVRLVSTPAGQSARVTIDALGTLPGRGAYLCRAPRGTHPKRECLLLAERRKAFARAFHHPVEIPTELVESVSR